MTRPITTPNTSQQPLRRSTRKRTAPAKYGAETTVQPNSPKRTKKTEHNKTTKHQSVTKVGTRKKVGLAGAPPPVSVNVPLGVVDPCANIDGVIFTYKDSAGVDIVHDIMLVMVDPPKHIDKYYILQLIDASDNYHIYQRWGRTGTSGTSLTVSFRKNQLNEAQEQFDNKFHEKTGLSFDQRYDEPLPGKYCYIQQDFSAKAQLVQGHTSQWQYWVDDGVNGKATGWYDYDPNASFLVEQLYADYTQNSVISVRIVQSGVYTYLVNLATMTQQNIVHPNLKIRKIRRLPDTKIKATVKTEINTHSNNVNNIQADSTSDSNKKSKKKIATPAVVLQEIDPNVKRCPKTEKKTELKVEQSEDCEESSNSQLKSKDEPVEIIIPVDSMAPKVETFEVFGDLDATLNQSNIMGGNNNNKFYKIQGLKKIKSETYYVWMRWGRVGESYATQTKLEGPFRKSERAIGVFEKKFKAKTGNDWNQRESFQQKTGKYDMVLIDHTVKEEEHESLVIKQKTDDEVEYKPSTLAKETRELIELLFEEDVYTDALMEFDIDVKRMPLGNLSKQQVERGVAVLEELEQVIKNNPSNRTQLARLSSRFYTTLPHDFGRRRPPVIANATMLQRSYDMCNVLLDMETATSLMAKAEQSEAEKTVTKELRPHPADGQYASLNADLELVPAGSDEYNTLVDSWKNTQSPHMRTKLAKIWRVNRQGETGRFEEYNKLNNHMLLWHGTHIGAVSAILSTGLRIMPHSGGRVGRGIYLASEHGKSVCYTTPAYKRKTGCMFLVEAALGKIHEIYNDDSSLTQAPNGFDSVRACGQQSPAKCKGLKLDGIYVNVHVESPRPLPKAKSSSFSQDEYLIYNEPQARLRYIITFNM